MEKRKYLSSLMQQPSQRTKASGWLTLIYLCIALVLLIGLSAIPLCEGSLVQKRSASLKSRYQLVQNLEDGDGLQIPSLPSHVLKKRETVTSTVAPATTSSNNSSSSNTDSKIKSSVVTLNDTHNQLLVFWAGEDVIICLAKDPLGNGSSTLWISTDYGGYFSDATSHLISNSSSSGESSVVAGIKPVIDNFFNHPSTNGHFALTDIKNKIIFITKNYGAEFFATKVEFLPEEVLFDPHSDSTIVAYEKTTNKKEMWVSIDFGKSWTRVQEHVKLLFWDETKMPAELYLQREEPNPKGEIGKSVILKSDSLFLDAKNTEVVLNGVEEFEITNEFMFATKPNGNETYDLLISYNHSDFRKAMFPPNQNTKHFYIADVSTDGQIFVCVVHNESISNLYIGSFPMTGMEENPKFTLSLERILYFKKNVTWPDSWLNDVSSESFVDLNSVEGLRGVYIASQLKPSSVSSGKFSMNEVISVVTYDQGGEWQVLSPPEFEHDGRPIYCQYKSGSNCSLHISQRLNELYPRTRAVPILSKKSAVGMVLATGTVNTTLKGHLGVYLSTNGAVSWRQILQGNYAFAFGDHGGIIVATKMYKIGEDTNELVYSIDEGGTWKNYTFYEEKVRIMGLMTEPGENTTVFFIFGSLPPNATGSSTSAKHTWVLIKIDFKDVFERECKAEDYKMWSPWDIESGTKSKRHCLLGRKESYERRISNHKCYNGKSYVRPISSKQCECERSDFECDFGYVVDRHSEEKDCIRDNSETSVGVKAEWCSPTVLYYNKTKGYRKIPGDTCEEGSWASKYLPEQIPCEVKEDREFLLVAKRDSVLRIDINHFDRVETLPLSRVQAVIAVDFYMKNNCIFWSDVQRKTISMLHLDGNSVPETLVSNELTSVEGIAFDWISHNLYFTDGGGSKIEVVRVDHTTKRMRRRLLGKPDVEKPRGIAVHPAKGYFFWTDWSTTNPAIGRSHMDGSNVKKIITNSNSQQLILKWPNGITVDYGRNRLFWVDANLDRMMSSDLDGQDIHIVLSSPQPSSPSFISHPFAVSIYKNSVYYDDWTTRSIYTADFVSDNYTADPNTLFQIKGNLSRLMDLKAFGVGSQEGNNLCASETTSNCSYLCFMQPNNTATCLCPDGFMMQNGKCVCPDGKNPNETTGACQSKCEEGKTFKCVTHANYCIINAWKCDGTDDCGDNSDEEDCDSQPSQDPNEFKCKTSGRLIPKSFVCDWDNDCGIGDTSDEEDCAGKNPCDPVQHFQCQNGGCVLAAWVCDQDEDCHDGSDEKNCTEIGNKEPFSCLPGQIKCQNENKCLSPEWVCDFESDCEDGSDERDCETKVCPDWKFRCAESHHCIMKTWTCDGEKDCPDGSDEKNCTNIVTPAPPGNPFPQGNCSNMSQMFGCLASKECIPIYWKCDRVKDCADGSDELGCDEEDKESSSISPPTITIQPNTPKCESDHWRCSESESKDCIPSFSVCDGFPDCPHMEDEKNCHNQTGSGSCPPHMRRCGQSKACILEGKWCDGKEDCPNRADEKGCKYPAHIVLCNSGSFTCDDNRCQPLHYKCNGRQDCYDGTDEDESVCHGFQTIYQVEGISTPGVDSTWFDMEWWLPSVPSKQKLKFIPSICEVESSNCKNATEITGRNYTFTDLTPYKKYTVTVFVVSENGHQNPPFVYVNVTTSEAEPTAPFGLVATQNSSDELILTWKKPHTLNGKLKGYQIYFQPPLPPVSINSLEESVVISNKQSRPVFLSGEKYTFWVTAVNGHGEGKASEIFTYTYNENVATISSFTVKSWTDHSVKLAWETVNSGSSNVDNYVVLFETAVSNSLYTFKNRTETKNKFIEIDKLAAGTKYKATLIPQYKGTHGSNVNSLTFTTKGSPLPKVEGFKAVSGQNGKVKLSWRQVKVPGKFMYGIYYGKTIQEIAEQRAKIITDLNQAETLPLEACENYLFDIGIVAESIGPLTESPVLVHTKMNPYSPPKNPVVKFDHADGEGELKINWRAPCDVMDRKVGYNITVVELGSNNSFGLSNVSYSDQNVLSYTLKKFHYGGVYQLTISTTLQGAHPSVPVKFEGLTIPFPEQINECHQCNPLTIYWVQPTLPKLVTKKGPVSYVVYLSKDEDFNNPARYEAEDTSFKFTELVDNGIYYAAVSVKDADGLESPRSSPIVVQHVSETSELVVIPGSSALAITITVVVVIIILVAVLGIFVVRHKRLQTSFLNFASSHYSSSSGAATFQQQQMEEQDSPVIRGFSDDEPLLVA